MIGLPEANGELGKFDKHNAVNPVFKISKHFFCTVKVALDDLVTQCLGCTSGRLLTLACWQKSALSEADGVLEEFPPCMNRRSFAFVFRLSQFGQAWQPQAISFYSVVTTNPEMTEL